MAETVTLFVDGRAVDVPSGSMVSTAVAASGSHWFRRSITGEPRAPLCGMGICFECRVTIDGEAHLRSCHVPCRAGMEVVTDEANQQPRDAQASARASSVSSQRSCDVLIVGGGPAGLAAGWAARQDGARVLVVDDNQREGGQIWRGESKSPSSPEARVWFDRISEAKLEFLNGARVFDAPGAQANVRSGVRKALAETAAGVYEIEYLRLILAAGARERFLPFPGWCLPNVVGAGGLQALVKNGLPIEGKRVVVAGTGPLLLAVANYLRKRGADVSMIAEQASRAGLTRFALSLLTSPEKAAQALTLRRGLKGIPLVPSCWVTAAEGDGKLERVVLRERTKTRTIDCDYLALGFHLVPNLEVATLLTCDLKEDGVVVDEFQQTSIPHVYAAGEATGIGGLDLSLVEGQIAGYAATGQFEQAQGLFRERLKARRFARRLSRTFKLRHELKMLPESETIVCRCEDVKWNQLLEHSSWRSAKLHTRCGMGPCQGRVCGPALSFLLEWKVESVRPPIFPVRIESLAKSEH